MHLQVSEGFLETFLIFMRSPLSLENQGLFSSLLFDYITEQQTAEVSYPPQAS